MSLFQNFKGTMQTDFLVGGPAGIMLRKVSGGFEVRNSDGSALEDITADNLIANTSVQTDTINEKTSDAGVTVDSVLIKDGKVDGVDVSDLDTTVTNHIADTNNPHAVDKTDVGLGNVQNVDQTNASNLSSGTVSETLLPTGIDATKIADGSVSNAEFQYLGGVTSAIQTQLDAKATDSLVVHLAGAETITGVKTFDNGLKTDTISEETLDNGVVVDGVTLKDGLVNGVDVTSLAVDNTVIKKDGSVAFTGDQSMGNNRLTNLAAPVDPNDAARLADVQAAAAGIIAKAACLVATTDNITDLAAGAPDTVDGVALSVGDRILVKEQTTQTQNGIYVVDVVGTGSNGKWSRATDFDGTPTAEVQGGNLVFVEQGTLNSNTSFYLTGQGELTVGTDNLIFIVYSRVENIVAGDALSRTGTRLDVNVDDVTVEVATDALQVKDLGISTAKIANDAVDKTKIAADVAGNGLGQNVDGSLEINVDGTTIEIATDAIQIKDGGVTNAKVATGIDATKIADGSVSNAEFQYLGGVTSAIQTQLDAKATDSLVVHLAGAETITGVKDFSAGLKADTISESTATAGVTIDGLLIKDGVVRGLDVDIANTTAETSVQDADTILIYDTSAGANRQMTRANFLSGIAAANGISKHIKFSVGTSDASSSNSIPTNAIVKAVYVKVTTPYSGGGTLQVIVDGTTTDTEIQATTENYPQTANVYKSEPIVDVTEGGAVKAVVGGTPATGAADVIVEYVEQFLA